MAIIFYDSISRQGAIDALNLADDRDEIWDIMDVIKIIEALPPADTVPLCVYEQVRNERDIALQQLEKLSEKGE